jgi:type IV pilus assembly protein PilV
MKKAPTTLAGQHGVMLLEALIAILIFSIGILAIVGMQAVAIQNVGEAKNRTDASFLANEILGDMWTDRANIPSFAYSGSGSAPPALQNWVAKVVNDMPGAATYGPKVEITATPFATASGSSTHTAYDVKVTVRWQSPRDASLGTLPHTYTTMAYIQYCTPQNGLYLC